MLLFIVVVKKLSKFKKWKSLNLTNDKINHIDRDPFAEMNVIWIGSINNIGSN